MKRDLDAIFGALADSTRRAILQRLLEGEAAVVDLAQPFDLSSRAIAKHVAVLESAGLVTRRREAQRNITALCPGTLREVEVWLQSYRSTWSERLGNLGAHLARRQRR